jgi:hypothetical protein
MARLALPATPALPQMSTVTSGPKKLRGHTVAPIGFEWLRLDQAPGTTNNFMEPPPDWSGAFPGGASRDEWGFYHALAVCFNDPTQPRRGPFVGGLKWAYQTEDPVVGGRADVGGAIVDFLIRESPITGKALIIRLQTEFFHIMGAAETIARDLYQKTHLSGYTDIVDVYSQWFIGDETGAAAIATARRALAGDESASPITFGLGARIRP